MPPHQGARFKEGNEENQCHKEGTAETEVVILEKIESHRMFPSKEVTDQNLPIAQSLYWPETGTREGQIRRHCNGSDKRR